MIPPPDRAPTLIGSFQLATDGQVLNANETAAQWLGFARAEFINRPFHSLLGSGGQFFWQSQIVPMLRLKGCLEEVYLRMREKVGATIPVLGNVALISDAARSFIEFSFIRIPQRGHLEDELLRAKKMAEQASDAKTKFLGMMSHELRTPLQAISLFNQALLENAYGELTAEIKEAVQSSQDCATSVTALIDDILNYSRMEGGTVQVTTENLPAEAALERAEVSIRHRFQQAGLNCVRTPVESGLMACYDANRLQQILLNLINNALKFTPRGGSVTLSAHREQEAAAFEVTDTGCGIPPEQLQRVFEPFVQLSTTIESSDKPGVGLGLAICQELAVAMGGRIAVRSTVGVGSTFSVLLPLARQS